ncbi:hypothetical protein J3A83DRAFT_4202202 [Scleroderma citrinum]
MPDVLRKRIPFAFKSEDSLDGNDQVVLDEQEQAELIEEIKEHNAASNKQNRTALQAMLGLSGLLHVVYSLSDRRSPLFSVFPSSSHDQPADAPIAFSGILVYIAILIHVNLSLIVHPYHVIIAGWTIRPIGFIETFVWATIGPIISIYLRKAWQTTIWWCVSAIMTGIVYAVHGWIQKVDEDVVELEKLQYKAPGA